MKFLCDEMLQRLGRWLRVAGYDTLIESDGRQDYELLQQALKEKRLLVTRDRELLQHRRAKGTVILLESNQLDDNIAELSQQLPINWLYQPFSRCVVCNTRLTASKPEQLNELPPSMSYINQPVYCPTCKKVYWDGSHVKRMRKKLDHWQANTATGSLQTQSLHSTP